MNVLALNLAQDIVAGRRSVDDARAHLAEVVQRFQQGQRDALTQSLQIRGERETGEPDQPARRSDAREERDR